MFPGLFVRGISTVSDQYPLDITPAGWAFSIWGVIYLHQFAWVIYNLALICRTTNNGPAYLNPVILSPAFLIFFNLSSAFNIGWLFLWDRILFMASLVFLACITLSLFLTFAIICIRVAMFKDVLVDQGRNVDLNFLNIAVVNGIGMYATWSTVATIINLGVVLTYKWRHPIYSEHSSIVCMGVLSFLFAIYIILDLTAFEKYTRYALAPYAVMIWALAAIISKNYNPANISFVMATVLLCVASLAFLLKLGLTAYRSKSIKYQYRQMRRGRPLVDEQ